MKQKLRLSAGRLFCYLRQSAAAISVTITCLLFTAVAYADCGNLKPADFARVKNKTQQARILQRAVGAAYSDLDERSQKLLNDGYIGTGTVKQFSRFCKDINLTASEDLPGRLIQALDTFVTIIDKRPDWKKELSSDPFTRWFSTLALRDGTYNEFFGYNGDSPLIPGAAFLLADYDSRKLPISHISEPPLNSPFMLKDSHIEKLAAINTTNYRLGQKTKNKLIVAGLPEELRASVDTLLDIDFESKQALVEKIDALVDTLAQDYLDIITDVAATPDSAKVAEAAAQTVSEAIAKAATQAAAQDPGEPSPSAPFYTSPSAPGAFAAPLVKSPDPALAVQAAPTVQATSTDAAGSTEAELKTELLHARLRAAGLPMDLAGQLPGKLDCTENNNVVCEFVKQYRVEIKKNIESTNDNEWIDSSVQALIEPFPEDVLASLESLVNVYFPDGDLFRTAVRLSTGLSRDDALQLNTILWVVHDDPVSSRGTLAPIQWRAGDCGCGVFETLDQEYSSHLYGIYPYWQAPQTVNEDSEGDEPEIIDFSMLDRIGYYGLTFDKAGKIRQKLHFKQEDQPSNGWFWNRRNYAEFVKRAHQYKTKVDLIVYNSQWQSWLPKNLDDKDKPAVGDTLIDDIKSLLTERIKGPVNNIKPLISLNGSPAKTMGDGITFDFDFRLVDARDQQYLFDNLLGENFFKTLSQRLRDYGDSYYINLIVPGECLIGKADLPPRCSYYASENLQKINPFVNIFLVDMSKRTPGTNLLDEMKKLREQIEARFETEEHISILKKVVPLVSPQLDETELPLTDLRFLYADWYFSGFATWQPNVDESIKKVLREIFIGDTTGSFLAKVETAVCNVACPQRWLLRAIIFLIAMVSAVYVIASYWLFELRKLYGWRMFHWGVILITAILIITLWCDPYWSKRRSAIMFLAVMVSLVYWVIAKRLEDRRRYYP